MSTRVTAIRGILMTVLMLGAVSAFAQTRGVRAGISVNPDQFYVGGHVDVKEIVDRFWFRPNAELGFGDHAVVLALNGEFVYLLRVKSREWTPYVGGGPALVIGSFRDGQRNRDTDVGPGFNFVGGIQQQKGFLAEIKIGAIDSPEFKLGVGWSW